MHRTAFWRSRGPRAIPPCRRLAVRRTSRIFARELRRAAVTYAEAHAGYVLAAHHQTRACFLQPYLFLILQGAHRRRRPKMPMERCWAHRYALRKVFNSNGFCVVFADPPGSVGDLGEAAIRQTDLAHQPALIAAEQAPQNLAFDHRLKNRDVRRPIDRAYQPDDCVQEFFRRGADAHNQRTSLLPSPT